MEEDNKTNKLPDFKRKVVERFSQRITDYVFLMIQNDRELMGEYLHVIAQNKSLANVNSQIAKEIKKSFNLENFDSTKTDYQPSSFLIQDFMKFKIMEE